MAPTFGGHRAGAAADENDQVGLVDDRARFRRAAVGADHADGERMLFVNGAFAADGRRHRRREPLGEIEQARSRLAEITTPPPQMKTGLAASRSKRAARFDGVRRRARSFGRTTAVVRIAPNIRSSHQAVLHIERQSDMGRAGPAGGDLPECLREMLAAGLRAIEHACSISSPGA